MVPYDEKHSARQFIRGKPIRFGYKVWLINSALGYCVQMEPYQGAEITNTELGVGGSVVVNLSKALPPATASYVLYFKYFFTSFRLLHYVSSIGDQATDTVRMNRIEDCSINKPVDKFKKT